MVMFIRHYVLRHNNHWLAFDETESCIGLFTTRREALKCVKAIFDSLGDDYVLNFDRNLGI